jgi:hypothetical protein
MLSILSSSTFKPRNGFSFAVLNSAGLVETCGEAQYGGNSTSVESSSVSSVVHSRFTFAALKSGGSVAVWGAAASAAGLPAIRSIVAHSSGFALIESATGAVQTLDHRGHNRDLPSSALTSGVSYVVASAGAFVAVKNDGTAVAWSNQHLIPSPTQALLHGVI